MKNRKKLTLTIGIPAYNEEVNIENLIKNLLTQKSGNYVLKNIVVISDGSTDNTLKIIRGIRNKKVTAINHKMRVGKSLRQNEIMKFSNSDVTLVLDADIIPTKNNFLEKMVEPFVRNNQIGLVSCRRQPLKEESYIEKVINFSFNFKLDLFENLKNKNSLYLCFGSARAFSQDLAKKIVWPATYSEDVYSYLFAKKQGYKFYFQKNASVFYRSPNNFVGNARQSKRFLEGKRKMYQYFDKVSVEKEYEIPTVHLIKFAVKHFLKHPILFSSYIALHLLSRFYKTDKKTRVLWEVSMSTKKLT